ncbi:hypothetical protein [Marinifilum sp.]|uniref:hypothetical protein n=1 Tax=Marinifilum sp. TaxID=2033137 RepID=UPI003BAD28BC
MKSEMKERSLLFLFVTMLVLLGSLLCSTDTQQVDSLSPLIENFSDWDELSIESEETDSEELDDFFNSIHSFYNKLYFLGYFRENLYLDNHIFRLITPPPRW